MSFRKAIRLLIVCATFSSVSLKAKDVAEIVVTPVDPNAPQLTIEQQRAMIEDVQSGIEPPSDGPELPKWRQMLSAKEWIHKYNFKQIILNSIRWYQRNSKDPKAKVFAQNLLTMFLASHTTETVGGVWLAQSGLSSESLAFNVLGPLLGGTISTPGLDPLCWVLGISFFAFPNAVGKIVYVPRVVLMKTTALLYQHLGVKYLYDHIFPRGDALKGLEKNLSKFEGTFGIVPLEDVITLRIGSETFPNLITLTGRREGNDILWERASFSHELENIRQRRIVEEKLKGLNWSLKESLSVLMEKVLNPTTLQSVNYVSAHERSETGVDVSFIKSIPLYPDYKATSLSTPPSRSLHEKVPVVSLQIIKQIGRVCKLLLRR